VASPRVVLTAAVAAQAAVSLVGFGLPSIGPALIDEYDLSLAGLGAVLAAFLFGSGLAIMPVGVIVDRYGSRVPLVAGSLLAALGLAAAALAPVTGVVFVGLFLTGVGSTVVPSAGFGALFRAYGPERRAWALGMRQTGVPIGGTVAAALLPAIQHAWGVRYAFVACGAAVLILGVGFALVADASPPPHARPGVELHRLVRAPGMVRLLVVATCYVIVLQSVLVFTVPSLRDAGFSAFVAGATFFVLNLTAGIARIVWGRVADTGGGNRRVRTLAEAGALAALGAAAFAGALHGGTAVVLIAMIVFAFGGLGWNALVYVVAGEKASPETATQAVAIAASLVFLVGALSGPPMGALASHAGWDAFWLVSAGIAAAGSLLALTLSRERPITISE
jgi:MFS family permease